LVFLCRGGTPRLNTGGLRVGEEKSGRTWRTKGTNTRNANNINYTTKGRERGKTSCSPWNNLRGRANFPVPSPQGWTQKGETKKGTSWKTSLFGFTCCGRHVSRFSIGRPLGTAQKKLFPENRSSVARKLGSCRIDALGTPNDAREKKHAA